MEEVTPQQDPLALAAPPPEIIDNVIGALKGAQRNFQETFYETPPAVDPTVRRSTRPVLPGSNAPNRTGSSSTIYEDSDGQLYSFNEGAPLRRVQTLPSTSEKMMKKTTSSIGH